MSDANGSTDLFPASLTKTLDLLPMLQAASSGLELLYPWTSNASSISPKLEPFVNEVLAQSVKYHQALKLSADVAQDGFTWTMDMEGYCTTLKKGSDDSELLNGYVTLMRDGAKDAQRRALELAGKFRCVSEALLKISENAERQVESSAGEVVSAMREIQTIEEGWGKTEKKLKTIKTVDNVATGSMLAGFALLATPPVFLAALGGAAVGLGIRKLYGAEKALEDGKMTVATANKTIAEYALKELEVIQHLKTIVGGIKLVIKHVDVVAGWWGDMDMELKSIETQVARLDGGSLQRMKSGSVRAIINNVEVSLKQRKDEFKNYKNQIGTLQTRYPPALATY